MNETTTPATTPAAPASVNKLGLSKSEYKGAKSTLCAGCGHDAVTNHMTTALYETGIEPHRVVKMSGIGCSSLTPAFFVSRGYGFNGLHGRVAPMATGVTLANRQLQVLTISGDGDTASIGMGHFLHTFRRNPRMVYVIENNGIYGLTKGQISATADVGSTLKSGWVNPYEPIDCCALAIQLGCGFVARTFSGDGKQLVPLMKAALAFNGLALIDVISPCMTFNNHPGSTKSYDWVKKHDIPLHELGFMASDQSIEVDYEEGTSTKVELPDGCSLLLKKLGRDYDPRDHKQALYTLLESSEKQELLTGLLYFNDQVPPFDETLKLVDDPLCSLPESRTRPSRAAFDEIMQSFR